MDADHQGRFVLKNKDKEKRYLRVSEGKGFEAFFRTAVIFKRLETLYGRSMRLSAFMQFYYQDSIQ